MSLPLSDTNIRLMSGVPFTNDYKDTRWFTSASEQEAYFNRFTSVHSATQVRPQKAEKGTYYRCDMNHEKLRGVNYALFVNENIVYYAFVTDLEYVGAERTNVYFELDVLQTWMFRLDFKPSYIAREHLPLYNADGSPYVNTIDEGLDYGKEYDTVHTVQHLPNGGYKWLVIVSKAPLHYETIDEKKLEPSVIGTPQPLSYYVVPYKDDNVTPVAMFDGVDFPITPPKRILEELYKSETAVNNIVSFYITESIGIVPQFVKGTGNNVDQLRFTNNGYKINPVDIEQGEVAVLHIEQVDRFIGDSQEVYSDKYSDFEDVHETKLLMYPYTVLVADDFKGNRMDYRLEYINNPAIRFDLKGSLGLSNKVSYGLQHYNHPSGVLNRRKTENEFAVFNNNPQDVPVINDYLTAYLQGNRNSMEHQKTALAVNGVMAGLGSVISADQSGMNGNLGGMASSALQAGSSSTQTVLGIQGINAKLADINNHPPSIAKMGSNTSYDYGNEYNGLFVMKKQIKKEYIRRLDSFFKKYGCKVNEVKQPNIRTRTNWNYIQTMDANIKADINATDLVKVKSIFDRGITLWHTNDVGNYNLRNGVR